MAGHSKFKNIQFRKGAQDKKRARIFARLSRVITVAAKMGRPEPEHNPRLRTAIQNARGQNMPKDNIEKAIRKSTEVGGKNYSEIRYEGFGPQGVAIIIESLTDNTNRTTGNIRAILAKAGGALTDTGSATFMFRYVGLICYNKNIASLDELFEAAVECGAEDVNEIEEQYQIYCQTDNLNEIVTKLQDKFSEPLQVERIWLPENTVRLQEQQFNALTELIDKLEEHEDVQKVFFNFEPHDSPIDK